MAQRVQEERPDDHIVEAQNDKIGAQCPQTHRSKGLVCKDCSLEKIGLDERDRSQGGDVIAERHDCPTVRDMCKEEEMRGKSGEDGARRAGFLLTPLAVPLGTIFG